MTDLTPEEQEAALREQFEADMERKRALWESESTLRLAKAAYRKDRSAKSKVVFQSARDALVAARDASRKEQ